MEHQEPSAASEVVAKRRPLLTWKSAFFLVPLLCFQIWGPSGIRSVGSQRAVELIFTLYFPACAVYWFIWLASLLAYRATPSDLTVRGQRLSFHWKSDEEYDVSVCAAGPVQEVRVLGHLLKRSFAVYVPAGEVTSVALGGSPVNWKSINGTSRRFEVSSFTYRGGKSKVEQIWQALGAGGARRIDRFDNLM